MYDSAPPEVQEMLSQVTGGKLNNRVRRALRAGLKPIREEGSILIFDTRQ